MKKFDFTIAFHQKVPKGMLVSEVNQYLESTNSSRNEVSSKFIYYLFARYLIDSPQGVQWKSSPIANYQFPKGALFSTNFIRTGPYNFVSCSDDQCAGLSDPISSALIRMKPYAHIGHSGRKNQECKWFYSNEIKDPFPSEDLQYEGCNLSIFDQENFISATGFNPGAYMSDKYLAVPEREQNHVCSLGGMKAGCFNLPTGNRELVSYRTELEARGMIATADALHKYIYSCDDHYLINPAGANESCFKQLAGDFQGRIILRHALAYEIALKAGIRISKKVQGDWIIHRIEWDSTLFCKYAQPSSDLYTH